MKGFLVISNNLKSKIDIIPISVVAILLLMTLIWRAKVAKKVEFHKDALALTTAKGLQGFSAVGVMLHHMVQTLLREKQDVGGIDWFTQIGVLFVGMFFFFSGYGLYTSLKSKDDYLKGFLRKRLPSILVPFYLCNTIFVLTSLALGERYCADYLIAHLTGWILLNSQLWFIVEILILYLGFYLLFRVIKKERIAYVGMGVFIILLMIGSLLLGHDFTSTSGLRWFRGEWWYNSTLLFFLGMTVARYQVQVKKIIQHTYWCLLPTGLILSYLLYWKTDNVLRTRGYWHEWIGHPGYNEKFEALFFQLSMVICIVLTFLLLTLKVQFKNSILNFLGKISLEIYLIHNLFITYLRPVIKSNLLFVISVYVFSILLATILNYLDRMLINRICPKNPV